MRVPGMTIFSTLITAGLALITAEPVHAQTKDSVSQTVMQAIYEEVKTPYKYGLIMVPGDDSKKMDCPHVFRKGDSWFMTYIQFDGRGYETWLAQSADLLNWKTLGRMMSFSGDTTLWDAHQKAGYVALQDYTWGGSYQWQPYNNNLKLMWWGA